MHSTSVLLLLSGLAGVIAAPMPKAGAAGSLQGQSCSPDGALACDPSGTSFYKCNWGKLVFNGPVAAGMICKDGSIVRAEDGAGGSGNTGGSTTGGDGGSAPPPPPPAPSAPAPSPPPPSGSPDGNTGGSTGMVPPSTGDGNGAGNAPAPVPSPEPTTTISVTSQIHVTVSVPVSTATAMPNAPAITPSPSPPPSSGDNNGGSSSGSGGDTSGGSQNVNIPPPANNPPSSSGGSSSSSGSKSGSKSNSLTEAQVLAVAPTSNTCSGAQFANECGTASQAAPLIAAAFDKYGITTNNEKAAILSLIAFESGDFKFNINHFPGRAGQGTRNMMMPPFIAEYAQSVAAGKLPSGVTKDNIDSQSDDVKNQVRALVLGDELSYASAAWFYSVHCSDDVKSALKTGGEQGWSTYISTCVGTTVTDDRKVKYEAAVKALGN